MMKHIQFDINPPTSEDKNTGNVLRIVHKAINEKLDEGLLPLGLTGAQWRPILLLGEGKINTAAQLADAIGVDTGAMTRTLDRLECKGLITRTRSQKDKRVVELSLTDKSRHLRTEIVAVIEDILNQVFACFDAEEFALFSKLNKKLLKHNAPAEFAVIFADECNKAPSQ
ncbi:MarR family transcriptional regulator [Oligella urethralis]|uniref:MarR family winged helix-turn-helix transcriptional regulator n=1 Tax=Oligella urethralis TaxID=90245 RepID=UPI002550BFC7|nr:MarR family transcriptional regulator [Oligella urethralis]MDK6202842.1 MarR family transcriptional regulator [Oligella urethralis]